MGIRIGAQVQSRAYVFVGVGLGAFGVLWVVLRDPSEVTYKTIEGISVFAALYVIAQGAERLTEFVADLLGLMPDSPEKRKNEELLKLRAANSTLNGNPTLADFGSEPMGTPGKGVADALAAVAKQTEGAADQKKKSEGVVKERRRDIAFLAGGLSIALCGTAVNALNYGLLARIGAENVNSDVDRLVTALAATGGTKVLHELIGRVQRLRNPPKRAKSRPRLAPCRSRRVSTSPRARWPGRQELWVLRESMAARGAG